MVYTPQHLNAPRLAGAALRAFTAVAEIPIAGHLLKRSMLKAAGIPAFRAITSNDAAIVVPPLPGGCDLGHRFDHQKRDAGDNDQLRRLFEISGLTSAFTFEP